MNNRPKLNIKEQINWFKDKGVTFKYFMETEAEKFLMESNYFFKLKAFAKNYDKNQDDKYINLDFAYLRELSILDTLLRDIILELCLTYEHLLKVHINKHCSENHNENGYEVVEQFLQDICKPKELESYEQGRRNIYQKDLISKYYIKQTDDTYKSNFALWNFIEILSFGEFTQFYDFYFKQYNCLKPYCVKAGFVEPIRRLRNAAAHNCCILNTLKDNNNISLNPSRKLKAKIKQMSILSRYNKLQQLNNPLIHDFLCLLFAVKELCPPKMFKKIQEKIVKFMKRALKYRKYFVKNESIESKFHFIFKVILKLISVKSTQRTKKCLSFLAEAVERSPLCFSLKLKIQIYLYDLF